MESAWTSSYNFIILNEIDSTNLEAKRIADSAPTSDFVIFAKSQTAGRGRYNRNWESSSGNIHMSILMQTNNILGDQTQLSFVSALSVISAIEKLAKKAGAELDIALKWPNDVLVSGKKISGILLESMKTKSNSYLVVGIGVNLLHHPDLKEKPTTSLNALGISYDSPEHILDLIMIEFEKYRNLWHEGFGFKKIRELWLEKAYRLNQVITVSDGKNRISGIFEDIEQDGSIRLRLTTGEICIMSTCEVFFGNESA